MTTRLDQLLQQSEESAHELADALREHIDEPSIRDLHQRLEQADRAWKYEAATVSGHDKCSDPEDPGRRERPMKCSSLMKSVVEICRRDESVESAAERMKAHNIGFLPVCDEMGAVVGTLTDRDLAIRVLGEHRSPSETRVQDVMSAGVVCCSPDDDLSFAEKLMAQHRKSRILCADDQLHPMGVISLSDIAHVEEGSRASEVLDAVAQREAAGPSAHV
jgi:CBS domain-containing protein